MSYILEHCFDALSGHKPIDDPLTDQTAYANGPKAGQNGSSVLNNRQEDGNLNTAVRGQTIVHNIHFRHVP